MNGLRERQSKVSELGKEQEFLVFLLCSGQRREVGAEQSPELLLWAPQKPCWIYRPEQAPTITTITQLMHVLMAFGKGFWSHVEHRRRKLLKMHEEPELQEQIVLMGRKSRVTLGVLRAGAVSSQRICYTNCFSSPAQLINSSLIMH